MSANIYHLQLIFTSVNILQQWKLMEKDILTEILFLKKKTKSIRKKNGCELIRINASNTKNGYDLGYKVGNIEAFIDEFKNEKIKEIEKK